MNYLGLKVRDNVEYRGGETGKKVGSFLNFCFRPHRPVLSPITKNLRGFLQLLCLLQPLVLQIELALFDARITLKWLLVNLNIDAVWNQRLGC